MILVTALVAACWTLRGPAAGDPALDRALERADEVATALGSDLKQRLLAEVASGGTVAAVRICSEVAQDLAASHSTDGLSVRRVSLKPRNPADGPDDFERAILVELETLHREGRLPSQVTRVVESDGGRQLRYLRPIVVATPCLQCHGPAEKLAPEVAEVIAERYPDDEATGYASGDFRGAISVTVRLD